MELRIDIDTNDLGAELQNQAAQVYHFGVELADAKADEDRYKASLDLTRAELDRDVRAAPAEFGVPKVTVDAVANAIPVQPVYKAAQKKWLKAKHAVHVLQATMTALEHRKRALSNLVDLTVHDLYSEPQARTTVGKEQTAEAAKRDSRSRSRRKRREPEDDADD